MNTQNLIYAAALLVLTGCHSFDSLTPEQQARRTEIMMGVSRAISAQQAGVYQERQLRLQEQQMLYQHIQAIGARATQPAPLGSKFNPIYVAPYQP